MRDPGALHLRPRTLWRRARAARQELSEERMPLHVDRTSIGLDAALLHEHAMERASRTDVATDDPAALAAGDVALDVRLGTSSAEVIDIARAETLARTLRADAIAQLRGVHAPIDRD